MFFGWQNIQASLMNEVEIFFQSFWDLDKILEIVCGQN